MENEQLYIKVNGEAVEITPKVNMGINIENGEGDNSIIQKVADEVEPNEASGVNAFAIGTSTKALGDSSHTEGDFSKTLGKASHAEGGGTVANGDFSHAEGNQSSANDTAHSEGYKCVAFGICSHAEGSETMAHGNFSHAEGFHTYGYTDAGHVEGKYNARVFNSIHIVGIGTDVQSKNAHVITLDGKHYIPGIGNYNGIETTFENIKDLATVINELNSLIKEPLIINGILKLDDAIGAVFESNEIYTASDIKNDFLNGRQIIICIEQNFNPNLLNLQYAKLCSISKTIYMDTNYYIFGFYGTDIIDDGSVGECINWLVETNE